MKVAYWDTEQQGGRPPRLLGEIKGTPTIRLFKPKKKQRKEGSFSEKVVVDYRFERKVKDMREFAEQEMPNFVNRIVFPKEDWPKAHDKAERYELPQAIFFTKKSKTSALTKWLSTEFRRRLLVVEVPPTAKNQDIYKQYGLDKENDLPALIIVKPSSSSSSSHGEEQQQELVRYTDGDFTRRKLHRFLSDHANKEPVYKPVVTATESKTENAEATKEGASKVTNEEKETKEQQHQASSEEEGPKKVHVEL